MANYSAVNDQTFRALADPTRRAIVERLANGPASVSELARPFTMALPSLMEHLRVLEASGLVRSEKRGRVRTCHLEAGPIQTAERWLGEQRAMWESRLDRLEKYLDELEGKETDGNAKRS
jgi:DNA-binding transcriptional ArsR family regulator